MCYKNNTYFYLISATFEKDKEIYSQPSLEYYCSYLIAKTGES